MLFRTIFGVAKLMILFTNFIENEMPRILLDEFSVGSKDKGQSRSHRFSSAISWDQGYIF